MRRSVAILAILALGACQAPAADKPAPVPGAAGAAAEPDTCGAAALQAYIGRPRSELPAPPPGKLRRMVCEKCPMTMDFNLERQTVIFDQATGVVRAARCG
jgi:hypothetical protein